MPSGRLNTNATHAQEVFDFLNNFHKHEFPGEEVKVVYGVDRKFEYDGPERWRIGTNKNSNYEYWILVDKRLVALSGGERTWTEQFRVMNFKKMEP